MNVIFFLIFSMSSIATMEKEVLEDATKVTLVATKNNNYTKRTENSTKCFYIADATATATIGGLCGRSLPNATTAKVVFLGITNGSGSVTSTVKACCARQ